MARAFSGVNTPRDWFTVAHARFTHASASMSSAGMRSPEILKCSRERCVWAPHKRSSGTSMGPKVSFSILVPDMVMGSLKLWPEFSRKVATRQKTKGRTQ